jgi:hypothetical protein
MAHELQLSNPSTASYGIRLLRRLSIVGGRYDFMQTHSQASAEILYLNTLA